MTSTELAIDLNLRSHSDLLRTIERLRDNGLRSEIREGTFTNKMNRRYKMYHLSDRVVNIIEGLYVFSNSNQKEFNLDSRITQNELVYFITDGSRIKIGCTSNLKTRLLALQVGNVNYIEVIATIENAGKDVEKYLHEYYSKDRISGEWFDLDDSFVLDVKKEFRYVNMHDTLDSLLFELWHKSKGGEEELSISFFTNSDNYRVKRKLKNLILGYINSHEDYSVVCNDIKKELDIYADSLNFNRIESKDI